MFVCFLLSFFVITYGVRLYLELICVNKLIGSFMVSTKLMLNNKPPIKHFQKLCLDALNELSFTTKYVYE